MKKTRSQTWNKRQWDLYTWSIYRRIVLRFGDKDYSSKTLEKWLFNPNDWLNEYPKKKIQDLRSVARANIKDYEMSQL